MTSLLTEGLVARGHDVTLFAPGDSMTRAKLHATFPHGYREDQTMWPWEMYELLNLAAAVERASEFDIIHYEAEYLPDVAGVHAAVARLRCRRHCTTRRTPRRLALWRRYPEAPFIAISREQARLLDGLNVAGIVPHGIDTDRFTSTPTPTTTCCSSDVSRQARDRCRRSRWRSGPACACCSPRPKSSIITRP